MEEGLDGMRNVVRPATGRLQPNPRQRKRQKPVPHSPRHLDQKQGSTGLADKALLRARVREPLGDHSGVEYDAFWIPSSQRDHPIAISNLAGINVVDLLAVVCLADPLR